MNARHCRKAAVTKVIIMSTGLTLFGFILSSIFFTCSNVGLMVTLWAQHLLMSCGFQAGEFKIQFRVLLLFFLPNFICVVDLVVVHFTRTVGIGLSCLQFGQGGAPHYIHPHSVGEVL